MATLSALVQELKALQSPSFFAVYSYTRGPQSSYFLFLASGFYSPEKSSAWKAPLDYQWSTSSGSSLGRLAQFRAGRVNHLISSASVMS